MKRVSFGIVIALLVLSAGFATAKHFWRGETMSAQQGAKKWGTHPFEKEKFKTGDDHSRATMASSLLQNQKNFVGKRPSEIREELGNPDGFYFSDMFPAYFIERGQKEGEDSWQLVFLLDRNEKVAEIIIHKNCCEK